MRLSGGDEDYEGRVEMCNSRSLWGTVCNKQWTQAHSKVVCHSLGFDDEDGISYAQLALITWLFHRDISSK